MYRLYSASNENIGVTEKLNYVRLHANGCYVLCEEKEAQGIAFNGEVYSLGLANSFTDKPVVRVTKTDTAVEIENNIATTGIAFVTMAEAGSIDAVTAAEHAELFSEWTCPIAYKTGNIRRYKGVLYKCIQDHTSQADWTPDTAVSLWTLTADPAEEWPAWSQPVGAHDAYSLGDQVSHNELLRDIPHTREDFIEVMEEIDFYEHFCEEHPDYKNNRCTHAVTNIGRVYDDRLRKHDFL